MALNIRKSSEPVPIGSLTALLYGLPGIGKTSVGCSAGQSLVLDFDHGIHRSAFRKDSVPISQWSDVTNIEAGDLAGYDTLVVDTVGKALDLLADSIMQADPKKGRGGQLTMQGFGTLKAQFTTWLKKISRMGIDIVLIAHVKEERNGDNIILRPDMTGGSYAFALQSSDLVGYQHPSQAGGAAISFAPTGDWVGKDCAQLGTVQVPNLADAPDFMAGIFRTVRERLASMSDAQSKAMEEVREWHGRAEEATTPEDMNALVAEANELGEGMLREQARKLVARRGKALGLIFREGEYHEAD